MATNPARGVDHGPALLTGRQAEARLATVGIARRQARQVLAAGLAGDPVRGQRALFYSRARVEELLGRPRLDRAAMETQAREQLPGGLLVLRRFVRGDAGADEARAMIGRGWDLGVYLPGLLRVWASLGAQVAVVVTVAGFVTTGFDLTGTQPDPDDPSRRRLLLDDPGEWFAAVRETRIDTGPGKAWHFVPPAPA